jgi:hypothetical protein
VIVPRAQPPATFSATEEAVIAQPETTVAHDEQPLQQAPALNVVQLFPKAA